MPVIQTQAVLNGERLALTRTLTHIENNTPEGIQILEELFPHTGKAHLVGVTGAPGTGKSTLVNRLVFSYRHPPDGVDAPSVAVVAVDPSSPFSGGAILGDRVRMQDLAGDPGVFIRSMASRGSLGGLASTTTGLVQVFDAAGFNIILIETVGAGQAEVEIASLAHTTVVVDAPGMGDEIQTFKAGILEIADILVVNKSDKPGADNTLRALRNMVSLTQPEMKSISHHGEQLAVEHFPEKDTITNQDWIPPVLPTISTTGDGIAELISEISEHKEYLKTSGDWILKEQARLKNEVGILLQQALHKRWNSSISSSEYSAVLDKVVRRQLSPRRAVDKLIKGAGL
ncbi:MAG: methylmalonyl Co-A mutase-associated GTPase MeaB [Anaerolineales bacterium]|nr:methylmalonyl Co-A mutase-associated GTPase MeaB [Anaerolineales bacterium]